MSCVLILILQDGVKASKFTKDGELLHFVFDDVRTVYEAFLRGKTVSSMSNKYSHMHVFEK